jgi:hypothetical protein
LFPHNLFAHDNNVFSSYFCALLKVRPTPRARLPKTLPGTLEYLVKRCNPPWRRKQPQKSSRAPSPDTPTQSEYTKTDAEVSGTANRHAPKPQKNTRSRKGMSAQGNTCQPAALASDSANSVHITLPLYKSHAHCPVGTTEKRPPADSERVCRSDITQGANTPDSCQAVRAPFLTQCSNTTHPHTP